MASRKGSGCQLLLARLEFTFSQTMLNDVHVDMAIGAFSIEVWQTIQLISHILIWQWFTLLGLLDDLYLVLL
jgi:hypothetical protein